MEAELGLLRATLDKSKQSKLRSESNSITIIDTHMRKALNAANKIKLIADKNSSPNSPHNVKSQSVIGHYPNQINFKLPLAVIEENTENLIGGMTSRK